MFSAFSPSPAYTALSREIRVKKEGPPRVHVLEYLKKTGRREHIAASLKTRQQHNLVKKKKKNSEKANAASTAGRHGYPQPTLSCNDPGKEKRAFRGLIAARIHFGLCPAILCCPTRTSRDTVLGVQINPLLSFSKDTSRTPRLAELWLQHSAVQTK